MKKYCQFFNTPQPQPPGSGVDTSVFASLFRRPVVRYGERLKAEAVSKMYEIEVTKENKEKWYREFFPF